MVFWLDDLGVFRKKNARKCKKKYLEKHKYDLGD